jgi:ring-1,2-phenylacetyl-CoA epoxidase subunit PaaD
VNIRTLPSERLWDILDDVKDPEIPVLSLVDLGVVRKAEMIGDKTSITITPTYSGCPAMKVMEEDIRMRLMMEGYKNVEVNTVLSPAWTTDWITEKGTKGIARVWYRTA